MDRTLDAVAMDAKAMMYVEAINHSLKGIPEEKVRFHTCYGINQGPRVHEPDLPEMIDVILKVKAGAFSFEAANPRHEHEYHLWEKVKLPEGKILMPGVITHAGSVVEHPEYVARKATWKKYRDLYVGGEQFKVNASEYLIRRQREPGDVYAERLSRDPRSVPWQQDFHARLASLRRSGGRITPRADVSGYLFLFVPGWDYEASGHFTGADFARPRARLEASGLATRLIEIPSTGSVEQSAAAIAASLRRLPASAPRIILVSASSGGPAAALALGRILTSAETCRVHAWVNIGGLLRGTYIFDPYRSGPRRWWGRFYAWLQGWEWDALESLGRERSGARSAELRLPGHLRVLNYIGIPLSGNVSELAHERYLSLRKYGPNDGLTLIADALVPGQPTIPVLGLDHFLAQDPELDLKTLALALVLIDESQKHEFCASPSQSSDPSSIP